MYFHFSQMSAISTEKIRTNNNSTMHSTAINYRFIKKDFPIYNFALIIPVFITSANIKLMYKIILFFFSLATICMIFQTKTHCNTGLEFCNSNSLLHICMWHFMLNLMTTSTKICYIFLCFSLNLISQNDRQNNCISRTIAAIVSSTANGNQNEYNFAKCR